MEEYYENFYDDSNCSQHFSNFIVQEIEIEENIQKKNCDLIKS